MMKGWTLIKMARKGRGLIFFLSFAVFFFFLWKAVEKCPTGVVWEVSGNLKHQEGVLLWICLFIDCFREGTPVLASKAGPDSQSPYQQVLPLCSLSPGKRHRILQGRSLLLQLSLSLQVPTCRHQTNQGWQLCSNSQGFPSLPLVFQGICSEISVL